MATLRDIAAEAGCAVSTVSRALAGSARISPARKARVLEAAERLGYRTNHVARSLRSQQTGYVGVIVPNLTNGYYTFCAAHLTDQLAAHGYHVVLCCHQFDPQADARMLRSLVERRVEAILHVPCTADGAEGVLGVSGIPIVEIGQRSRSRHVDAVYADDATGIALVVRYLAGLGHRRIVMLAGRSEVIGVAAQSRGFQRAVEEAGLSSDDCQVIHGPANQEASAEALDALLDSDGVAPTAVIAAHTFAASAALLVLRRRRIAVPDEVSLVGFSNDDWFAVSSPPVTTFEHPFREMTIVAAQLLVQRLHPLPDEPTTYNVIEFGGRILERSSTTVPRRALHLVHRSDAVSSPAFG